MPIARWVVIGLTMFPSLALANANIAGFWTTEEEDSVKMEMNVTADGQWNSETFQNGTPVAEMAGYYQQHPQSPTTGRLVFVPSHSHVTAAHVAPKAEYDAYELLNDGQVLRLTSGGDTMQFHKITP